MVKPPMSQPESGTFAAPLTEAEKQEAIKRFWPHPQLSIEVGYSKYFRYYEKICKSVSKRAGGVSPKMMVANTHAHIFQIVDTIYEILGGTTPCTRPEVRRLLRTREPFGDQPDEKLNHSIDLTLRLWLLINVQEREFARGISASWDDNTTLRDLIEQQFPGPRGETKLAGSTQVSTDKERNTILESNFTAANLERIAGIRIEWTSNMLEHLRFNKQKRKLWIFPLKQFLHNQQDVDPEVIPSCITTELIHSLNLLFPDGDRCTQKFLSHPSSLPFPTTLTDRLPFTKRREPQTFLSEEPVHDHGRVYLFEFYHFRDRLAEIAYEFSSPPPKVKQVWTDRRNALQWWTFWFAFAIFCFTIIFGAVTILLAGLQTRYAYEMLVIARDAAESAKACPPTSCGVITGKI